MEVVSTSGPPRRLTRRKDGERYVVEDESGRRVATCTYRFGVLRRIEANGVAYRIRGRWWRFGAFDALDAASGTTALTLRRQTIVTEDGTSFRCLAQDRDGGPRPHRAERARMLVVDSTAHTVMTLTWDGAPARHGTSTKTFERGSAQVEPDRLGPNVGLVVAVAFHLFSTARGGAG
jgi:hypothetical protein